MCLYRKPTLRNINWTKVWQPAPVSLIYFEPVFFISIYCSLHIHSVNLSNLLHFQSVVLHLLGLGSKITYLFDNLVLRNLNGFHAACFHWHFSLWWLMSINAFLWLCVSSSHSEECLDSVAENYIERFHLWTSLAPPFPLSLRPSLAHILIIQSLSICSSLILSLHLSFSLTHSYVGSLSPPPLLYRCSGSSKYSKYFPISRHMTHVNSWTVIKENYYSLFFFFVKIKMIPPNV